LPEKLTYIDLFINCSAYNAGYFFALQDVLEFLQSSLDNPSNNRDSRGKKKGSSKGGATLGGGDVDRMAASVQAVMNYIEVRSLIHIIIITRKINFFSLNLYSFHFFKARQQACRLLSEDDPNSEIPAIRSNSPSKPSSQKANNHNATPSTPNLDRFPSPTNSNNSTRRPSNTTPSTKRVVVKPHLHASTSTIPINNPLANQISLPSSNHNSILGVKRKRSPTNVEVLPIKLVGNDMDLAEIFAGSPQNGGKRVERPIGDEDDEEPNLDFRMNDVDDRPSKRVTRR
jgi:hypothetical protein